MSEVVTIAALCTCKHERGWHGGSDGGGPCDQCPCDRFESAKPRQLTPNHKMHGTSLAPTPSPADRIRERIAQKRALYEHYLVHAKQMLGAEDLHGLWDSGANASEVHTGIDELEWCLKVLEGRE
jgi:hypothetical protein